MAYSEQLQKKIGGLKKRRKKLSLGTIDIDSRLVLAPMSAICNAPFRLLMEELGAGATVSELISCHGINHQNKRTKAMLFIHPKEKNIGIQLFGEDPEAMAKAAETAVTSNYKGNGGIPRFIDINMGCPVRKVVSKGGGSALLKEPKKLSRFFAAVKKSIPIPLTIKIRTGWDESSINADEVITIAEGEGVEFVSVHGRTRSQQYRGSANWQLLNSLAQKSPLPIIGNGDLHSPTQVRRHLKESKCHALMLGRGPLRRPFIFLTSLLEENEEDPFTPSDYLQVIMRYKALMEEYTDNAHVLMVQVRKLIVWFSSGFRGSSFFREQIFAAKTLDTMLNISQNYFAHLEEKADRKQLELNRPFMNGGHG